jgi:nitroreductase
MLKQKNISSENMEDNIKSMNREDLEGLVPVAIIPIGYPAEKPSAKPRRALDDIVHEL